MRLLDSFRYAFHGIWRCVKGERNFRIHTLLAALSLILGVFYRLSPEKWAVLWLTIGLVLCAEGMNTAIEAAVDLSSPQKHPLAALAKDAAAGAVLLAALAAVGVGFSLFGEERKLLELIRWLFSKPVRIVCGLFLAAAGYWYVFHFPKGEE